MDQTFRSKAGVQVTAFQWPENMTLDRRTRRSFPPVIEDFIKRGDLFYTTVQAGKDHQSYQPITKTVMGFTIRSGIMLTTGGPGDWIVVFASGLAVVLTSDEFSTLFIPNE